MPTAELAQLYQRGGSGLKTKSWVNRQPARASPSATQGKCCSAKNAWGRRPI